ncbi:protein translocase subunit SecF [Candidatus Parcubacteria bacterium]|nr:MAG: protein translocase subunit SecF [Candidatus Parcubacteria bacterium]
MIFLKYKIPSFIFSGILLIASIAAIVVFGLKLGIDFTGGTLWEFSFDADKPSTADFRSAFQSFGLNDALVQPSQGGLIVRTRELDEIKHQEVLSALENSFPGLKEERFDSIGPAIGAELKQKALSAAVLAVIGILLYIAFAFRKIPKPYSSWKFSMATIIALVHDVFITIGIFAVLGRFYNVEIGLPFVAAILTILGYSVNDTVVVFDRVRENLLRRFGKSFGEVVENSLNQTLVRSIITSLLVLFALLAILLWGGPTIWYFALALLIGIGFGTYSSIFVATFLLTSFHPEKRG